MEAGRHVFLENPWPLQCRTGIASSPRPRRFQADFMVGHICRFNRRNAAARAEIATGTIGEIVSIYARRSCPQKFTAIVLDKITPISSDVIQDTGFMLWYTGADVRPYTSRQTASAIISTLALAGRYIALAPAPSAFAKPSGVFPTRHRFRSTNACKLSGRPIRFRFTIRHTIYCWPISSLHGCRDYLLAGTARAAGRCAARRVVLFS